jgi:hypothetical protein
VINNDSVVPKLSPKPRKNTIMRNNMEIWGKSTLLRRADFLNVGVRNFTAPQKQVQGRTRKKKRKCIFTDYWYLLSYNKCDLFITSKIITVCTISSNGSRNNVVG